MQLPAGFDLGDPGGLDGLRGSDFQGLGSFRGLRGSNFEGLRGSNFEGHVNELRGAMFYVCKVNVILHTPYLEFQQYFSCQSCYNINAV